jgi:hypothetical protein
MLLFENRLRSPLVERASNAKTSRDGYHAYHVYQRSPNHVQLGAHSYISRGISSSWQTRRPTMATMATATAKTVVERIRKPLIRVAHTIASRMRAVEDPFESRRYFRTVCAFGSAI